MRPAREEGVPCRRVGIADEAHDMNTHLELLGIVSRAYAGLAIEIDERAKPFKRSSNDRHHQREAERTGAREGLRCAANADP